MPSIWFTMSNMDVVRHPTVDHQHGDRPHGFANADSSTHLDYPMLRYQWVTTHRMYNVYKRIQMNIYASSNPGVTSMLQLSISLTYAIRRVVDVEE